MKTAVVSSCKFANHQINYINQINKMQHIKYVQSQQIIELKKTNQIIQEKLRLILGTLKKLEQKYKQTFKQKATKKKGRQCSINGNNYEKKIHNVIKNATFGNSKFTIQKESDLAGSRCGNDLECIFNEKIIGIEAKIFNTPDWMQCSLKPNNGVWASSKKGKIPELSRNIFDNLLKNIIIFDGKIPPFFDKKHTHEQWVSIKKKTNDWNDCYIDIPSDTIKNIYRAKGCYYIQISKYGLYHLGDDIYKFGVPEFIIKQEMRIRTKIHTRKNKKGFCSLSVTAACKPKNINKLPKSQYSLDDANKLPKSLVV